MLLKPASEHEHSANGTSVCPALDIPKASSIPYPHAIADGETVDVWVYAGASFATHLPLQFGQNSRYDWSDAVRHARL
jgi:hypothetical protein